MERGIHRYPTVLWVNQFAATASDGGGTRHLDLGRALGQLGWDVTVIASDFHLHQRRFTRRSSSNQRGALVEQVAGITFLWLWSFPYGANDWRRVVNWLSFGWEVVRRGSGARRSAVVVGSSPQLFAALGAWVLARRQGAAFVLEVRDLWPESMAAVSGRRGLSYQLLGILARFLYRRADRVIVLARGAATVIEACGVPAQRIVWIPNGVDPASLGNTGRVEHGIFTVIYAGAHGPANGLETVLDAAEQLKDHPYIRFMLVGDGPSKANLVFDAARRGLGNVEFRESVAKPVLHSLFAEADCGIMVLRDAPLFSWGVSPNKLFDYLGDQLPVVCNVPGDVAEMLASAGGGVQAADHTGTALAKAVLRMFATPFGERLEMGRSGKRWVLSEHNRTTLAFRVDALFREIQT
ncbi:MAG: glycosyltransferase family 4 protein [Gemmatimonadota bacterium]